MVDSISPVGSVKGKDSSPSIEALRLKVSDNLKYIHTNWENKRLKLDKSARGLVTVPANIQSQEAMLQRVQDPQHREMIKLSIENQKRLNDKLVENVTMQSEMNTFSHHVSLVVTAASSVKQGISQLLSAT